MTIEEKIRSLRLFMDMTQEDPAAGADLTKGFVSLPKRDLQTPSPDTLEPGPGAFREKSRYGGERGLVCRGRIVTCPGKDMFRASKEDAFCCTADKKHRIENRPKTRVRIICDICSDQFLGKGGNEHDECTGNSHTGRIL